MAESEKHKIELKSEEFQEVLGRVPSWILRYGIILIGILFLMLLAGSAIFKYPETVTATMTLTGTNPPAALIAKESGKLKEISVSDNQFVKEGTCLAVVENAAETKDILLLEEYLSIYKANPDTITFLPPRELKLGNLQSLYSSYYTALLNYKEFISFRYYKQKIDYTKEEILEFKEYYKSLYFQDKTINNQYEIVCKQFRRDSLLFSKGLISEVNLEDIKKQELQQRLSVQSSKSTLQNTKMQITQKEEGLLDMMFQYQNQENTLKAQLEVYNNQLTTEIESWKQKYLFVSPISGKVIFTTFWAENQNVTSGDVVFNIVPTIKGKLIGKATMGMNGSGKVKTGQKVNIRFLNFQDNEVGIVKGIVRSISLVPVMSDEGEISYIVGIELPDGLKTTYNKELPYLPEMRATAEIITDDLSALGRIMRPMRKIWSEGIMDGQK